MSISAVNIDFLVIEYRFLCIETEYDVVHCISFCCIFQRKKTNMGVESRWRLLPVTCLLLLRTAVAFNIDTDAPIVKRGRTDSYFGFSLVSHFIQDRVTAVSTPV